MSGNPGRRASMFKPFKSRNIRPEQALPGRDTPMRVPATHFALSGPLHPEDPRLEQAVFGMGCFWGAEKRFWGLPGVKSTAVGYAGGFTPNPTYEEVCTGLTGHAEVVRIWFDPSAVSYSALLKVFWENHDPTQGMRQGNDIGTQYRSAVYWLGESQRAAAEESKGLFQERLQNAGFGEITTEIREAPPFYFAEEYHQQYLAKNPAGYCGLGGTGVSCPVGVVISGGARP
jgi:peptide-methionine (S)-S-oxide reductase